MHSACSKLMYQVTDVSLACIDGKIIYVQHVQHALCPFKSFCSEGFIPTAGSYSRMLHKQSTSPLSPVTGLLMLNGFYTNCLIFSCHFLKWTYSASLSLCRNKAQALGKLLLSHLSLSLERAGGKPLGDSPLQNWIKAYRM